MREWVSRFKRVRLAAFGAVKRHRFVSLLVLLASARCEDDSLEDDVENLHWGIDSLG